MNGPGNSSARSYGLRLARWGCIACFVVAVRGFLGIFTDPDLAEKPLDNAIAWSVGAGIFPLIAIVCSVRLYAGKGQRTGLVLLVLIAIDILIKAANAAWMQVIIQAVLSCFILIGVRGAWAVARPNQARTGAPD